MFKNSYFKKKVLVTGHTGFKGSWLATWLKMLGAKVIGVSLKPNTNPSHFEILNTNTKSYFSDIRNYEDLSKIIKKEKPDIIFHLAAQPLVRESYAKPIYTLETNIMGVANILNISRELDSLKGILIITSDKCYENKEWVWGYRENDPMGGYDPYSASKGCAELVISSFRNSYFNLEDFGKKHQTLIASARAGNVIGGGDWAKDRLIPDIMRAILKNEKVQIRNPKATRPWQHVLECLSGYLSLGTKLLNGEKSYASSWNFAPDNDGTVTVLNVIEHMKKYWSKINFEIQETKNTLHEANLLKLDCSKAHTKLMWTNVWNQNKTVEITTNWYRDFYENQSIDTLNNIESYMDDANKNRT